MVWAGLFRLFRGLVSARFQRGEVCSTSSRLLSQGECPSAPFYQWSEPFYR